MTLGALILEWLKQLPTVAVGTLAVYFAYRLIKVTREVGAQQFDVAQREVEVAQQQVREAQQSRYDQYRPMLMPNSELIPGTEQYGGGIFGLRVDTMATPKDPIADPYVDISQAHPVWLYNIGAGPALNVRGVIFPMKPEPGVQFGHQYFKFDVPIEAGNRKNTFSARSDIIREGDTHIDSEKQFTLFAPPRPKPGTYKATQLYPLARLVVTYKDVFGRKHASVFDYLHNSEGGRWMGVEKTFLPDIPQDLDDIARGEQLPFQSPGVAPREPSPTNSNAARAEAPSSIAWRLRFVGFVARMLRVEGWRHSADRPQSRV